MSEYPKIVVKTTKSVFDIQMDTADKELKHKKGIAFARLSGNQLDYVAIPSLPAQRFIYFENTSKLTNEERTKLKNKVITKILPEEDKELIASIIDKRTMKELKI